MKVLKDLVVTGNASAANLSGTNTGDQDLSNLVVKNAPITGATKTKITYDSKGLVTAGVDATTADIASSTNKNYVTDADLISIANILGDLKVAAGTVTQPTVTNHGNGLLDVSSCTVHLFDNANNTGYCNLYTVPAMNGIQLTAGIYYYLSAKYNGGTPVYELITDNTLVNHSDRINVLQFTWENAGAHNGTYVFSTGNYGLGLPNKIGHRLIHTQRFGYESGFALTVDSSLHLILTGGYLWYDGEEIILPNTIDTNTMQYYFYYKSAGVWTASLQNTLNVTQYNDGTNLATLGNNHYAVAWVYRCVSGDHLYVVPGEGDYTLVQAQSSLKPIAPAFISKMAVLIGKIITQKNASTITQYIPLLEQAVGTSSAVEWGSISGILANQTDLNTALAAKVAGPSSSTDTALAIFNSTSGKIIQNSPVTLDTTYGTMRFPSTGSILVNTIDGADDGKISLCGAGGGDTERGGYITVIGNEKGIIGGNVQIIAGTGVQGAIQMFTGNSGTERILINSAGSIKFNGAYTFPTSNGSGALTNDGAGNLTWTPATGGMTNPMTTLGDIIYGGASGVTTRLAGNATTTPFVLTSTGSGSATAPVWTTTANSANSVMMRDSNVNVSLNNAVLGYTTTATASQTTTLNISSSRQQFFTGTTAGQIVQMPVTSTLVAGFEYLIVNTSNQTITINSSGSNLIGTLAAGGSARLVCVNTGVTTAAGWYFSVASYNSIIPTWDIALNTNLSIYMGSGSNTTWYAYGTLFTPRETTSVSLNSTMKWIMTSASSGYFIMAVYKYVNGGSQTLMFKSSATALGGTAGHLSAQITSITDGTLVAGTWYYMVIIQNQNGPSSAGVSLGGTSTIKPYRNFTQSLGNLGADGAGSAPSTITEPSGETSNGTPWILLKL